MMFNVVKEQRETLTVVIGLIVQLLKHEMHSFLVKERIVLMLNLTATISSLVTMEVVKGYGAKISGVTEEIFGVINLFHAQVTIMIVALGSVALQLGLAQLTLITIE